MIKAFPEVVSLRIEPLDGGWLLICARNDLAQIYRSGAEAERQARRYAGVMSRCGYAPRLVIHDRGGRALRVRL